jgi:hypothetical protein
VAEEQWKVPKNAGEDEEAKPLDADEVESGQYGSLDYRCRPQYDPRKRGLTMPLSEPERIALQAAMDAAGVKFKQLILGPDHRTPVVTDFVDGLEWAMEDGEAKSLSRVADTDVEGIRVSTVFIPMLVSPYDHDAHYRFSTDDLM